MAADSCRRHRWWLRAVAFAALAAVGSTGSGGTSPPVAEGVWRHFQEIRGIPRCSGQEAAILAYVRGAATDRGLSVVQDAARNLIIKRPGSAQGVGAAPVMVQAHVDMVCEQNRDSKHDWTKDRVKAVERDGWLVADETTLGADNGIGLSILLALLDLPVDTSMPPLEAIVTVEEETGLDGATNLDVSLLKGRRMLNFDSEEWGVIYIGCAGGGDAHIKLPVTAATDAEHLRKHRLELKGLRGGHSGADIHEERGNALLLLARAFTELQRNLSSGVRLLHLEGGNKDNAIPRESHAYLGFRDTAAIGRAKVALAEIQSAMLQEFGRVDPGLTFDLAPEPLPARDLEGVTLMDEESANRLLDLLLLLPNGVEKNSHELPGLVETSNNVARVRRAPDNAVEVTCLARSSIDPALDHVLSRIKRLARLCGGTVSSTFAFPGWAPNASQALLATTMEVFERTQGIRPNVTAIHAGLETGIIGSKMPGIEIVSFGPDIVGAHAPGERVRIESVNLMWGLVLHLMEELTEPTGKSTTQGDEL